MPYQYGTANNADDLLGKLREFLLANGFTANMWADDATSYATYSSSGSTEGKRLHVQRGDVYWNFRSAVRANIANGSTTGTSASMVDGINQYMGQFTGLAASPSTGFDGTKRWEQQPGAPTYSSGSSNLFAGAKCLGAIPSYRFFLDLASMELCISIEYEVGKWRHLILGTLRKYGEYEGGMFCAGCTNAQTPRSNSDYIPFASESSSTGYSIFVRAIGASSSGWVSGNAPAGGDASMYQTLVGMYGLKNVTDELSYGDALDIDLQLLASEPSNYTSIVPLIPIRICLALGANSNYSCRFLGEVAGLRLLRMDGYSPGDIITMGADRWMVLPLTFKEPDKACVGFAIPYDGV